LTASHRALFWERLEDGRFRCDLCPRRCRLRPGQRAFCYVRAADEEGIVLTTYGRCSGLQVDPIEKKPLYHYRPGTRVLSLGSAGCNLGCRFCQNWRLSRSRQLTTTSTVAGPEEIVEVARAEGCESVAFTYNDPIIFAEYARDTALLCRAAGIGTVAVTAGYVTPEAREWFFEEIDAANVDLKAFDGRFYREQCLTPPGALETVLETLRWLKHESRTHLEITTLLIPGLNDSEEEIRAMCRWVVAELGTEVPHHFTAFHPAYRTLGRPATSPGVVRRAREIALEEGELFPYTGNIGRTVPEQK
jgi:pyruvate formate lyase activating enzyme